MENLRPNEKRARNAILLIKIILALEIISLSSTLFDINLIHRAYNGLTLSMDDENIIDIKSKIIGMTYLTFFIISAITFILWFRRAYYNLHLIKDNLSNSDKWATISWFIPILNVIKPYQIMLEIFQITNELLLKHNIKSQQKLSEKSISWWWILWISNLIIGRLTYRFSDKIETSDDVILFNTIRVFNDLIGIPLALITIKIIKDYSNIEPLLNEIKDNEEVNLTT